MSASETEQSRMEKLKLRSTLTALACCLFLFCWPSAST